MRIIACAGSGKTTTILCIAKMLYGKYFKDTVLELNASDDRGIKTINSGVIGNFCHFKLPYTDEDKDKYCKHKLIILDESDNMTEKVLPIISMLMDTYYNTTRFVFTCNSSAEINETIRTKCRIWRYGQLSNELIIERLKIICENEDVKYTKQGENNGKNLYMEFSSIGCLPNVCRSAKCSFYSALGVDR